MSESFVMTPEGAQHTGRQGTVKWHASSGGNHTGAAIDDAATALGQLDAAIARSDWASVVKLEPSVGSAIDSAAIPAYGSNVAQAATLAGQSQQNTQAAWATNTALAAQVAAGTAQSEMASSAQMISTYLHNALSEAQQALSALASGGGGGMPGWLPWAGLGALGGLVLLLVARSRRGSP